MLVSLIILAFLLAVVAAVAFLAWKYSWLDVFFLLWLLMPLWFRGQLSLSLSFFFLDQVFLGVIWPALSVGIFCLLARNFVAGPRMPVGRIILWLILLMFVSLLVSSGVAKSPLDGFAKSLQANLAWMSALVGALGLVALVPTTEEHHDRLIRSFVAVFGYVLPVLMIALALMPTAFSQYFQWDPNWTMVQGEFTRTRSPIGSGISSGLLVMMAMALAVGQLVRGRHLLFYVPVLFLGMGAILFSLARSVVLALAVFSLVFFFRMMMRNLGRTVLVAVAILVLLGPLVGYLATRYDMSRLLDYREVMQSLRFQSAVGAWNAFWDQPVTGYGAGQLYHQVRVPDLLQESTSGEIERVVVVGGMPSAREPHNLYLFIMVEYGLIGVAIFGVGLFFWLRAMWRARAQSGSHWVSLSDAYWAVGIAWGLFSVTNSGPLLDTKTAFGMWVFFFMVLHNAEVVRQQFEWAGEGLEPAGEWLTAGSLSRVAG